MGFWCRCFFQKKTEPLLSPSSDALAVTLRFHVHLPSPTPHPLDRRPAASVPNLHASAPVLWSSTWETWIGCWITCSQWDVKITCRQVTHVLQLSPWQAIILTIREKKNLETSHSSKCLKKYKSILSNLSDSVAKKDTNL